MGRYVLSRRAEDDLAGIAVYTIENFGVAQARIYRDLLVRSCELLAENPRMGRDYGRVVVGIRRHDTRGHAIFYRIEAHGILIVRILGRDQDPVRHLP